MCSVAAWLWLAVVCMQTQALQFSNGVKEHRGVVRAATHTSLTSLESPHLSSHSETLLSHLTLPLKGST